MNCNPAPSLHEHQRVHYMNIPVRFHLPPESSLGVSPPLPSFLWSIEYGTRVITILIDAVNHPLLMHNVIESENSVYADRIPGALTAGIMIRRK